MNLRVHALGHDDYWLSAVQRAAQEWAANPATLKCSEAFLKCISDLTLPKTNTILLIDASGQRDLPGLVKVLRDAGWKYVIVVAADPSAKEAAAVLRRNLGYDYWSKTYNEEEIHSKIKECFNEILAKKQVRKKKRNLPGT